MDHNKAHTEKSRARIGMLITNLGSGGAQRVFHDHTMAFAESYDGIQIVFDKEEDKSLFTSPYPLADLRVDDENTVQTKAGPLMRLVSRCRRLKRLVEREDLDIVISHMDGANWVNVLSRSRARKVLVVHGTIMHDKGQHPVMQWLRKKLIIPFIYNRGDLTVAVSEAIAYEMRHFLGVKNVIAIPNFFDERAIAEMAAAPLPEEYKRIFSKYKVLINSGRFAEQKQQRHLLPVFRDVLYKEPGTKLFLLGDGPLRRELIEEAEGLGLRVYHPWDGAGEEVTEDFDVYMPGYLSNPFQYLQHSTMFLFPSGWEGFPLALCEAMITGIPVLSSDCPTGPREILSPGTFDATYSLAEVQLSDFGYLMPMTDKQDFNAAWTSTILHLLGDEDSRKRLGDAARERANDFGKQKIVDKWYHMISDQLKAGNA